MATRGRKPKPTELKLLEGNPGKRPVNEKEPSPKKQEPHCPSWLETEAKKEWKHMSKTLDALRVLTQVEGAAFAGYCQAYARWKEAEEFVNKHGTIFKTPSGYIQQVPQVSIAATYLKVMKDFCSEDPHPGGHNQGRGRRSHGGTVADQMTGAVLTGGDAHGLWRR